MTLDWRSLRPIIDNKFVSRVFIWLFLLPVSANVASKFPDQTILFFDANGEAVILGLTLPFTWYILYLAAVSFSISRLVFLKFCPSFVKSYYSAGDAISKGVTAQMYSSDLGDEVIAHIGSKGDLSDLERDSINRFLRQLDLNPSNAIYFFNHTMKKSEFAPKFRKCLARVKLTESHQKPGYYLFENRSHNILVNREQLLKHLWWDLDRVLKQTHLSARVICALFAYFGYALLFLVFAQSAIWVIISFTN